MLGPIIFDIDGVLADFDAGFRTLVRTLFNRELPAHNQWEYEGITRQEKSQVWREIEESRMFWFSLPCLLSKDECTRLLILTEKRDVYFVTDRFGEKAKKQTEDWLKCVLYLRNPTVILSENKADVARGIAPEWVIDDKVEHLRGYADTDDVQKIAIYDAPYNRLLLDSFYWRVNTVGEFLDLIERESE